jgi:hypothetical protein
MMIYGTYKLTPIQKKFARSKAARRAFFDYIRSNICKVYGQTALFSGLLEDIVAGMTPDQIRRAAILLMDCSDIQPSERAELMNIAFPPQ